MIKQKSYFWVLLGAFDQKWLYIGPTNLHIKQRYYESYEYSINILVSDSLFENINKINSAGWNNNYSLRTYSIKKNIFSIFNSQ